MDALKVAFSQILQLCDRESVRALVLDCFEYAQAHGEDAGVRLAAILKRGVADFLAHERLLQSLKSGASGPVLGERPPPVGSEWWGLLEDGAVVSAGGRRAKDAVYWCDSAAGWFRVGRAGRVPA